MRNLSVGLIAIAFLGATAAAQSNPQVRNGFTISFGVGGGSAGVSCDQCDGERRTSTSGYLRLGGAVKPNFVLAGEANAWSKSQDGATFTISSVNVVGQWYPRERGGFFVSGGVGFGYLNVEIETGIGTLSNNGSGFAWQAGGGYDIRVRKNFSLTPFVTYFATTGVEFEHGAAKADGNVFHFGLGFTWH
jgi:hypothetical protein